jgi:hypothetical protein
LKASPRIRAWTGLLAVVGGLVPFAPAAGQESVLAGRALDAGERPVAGLEVMLHRVTPAGGATIARDTTAADGGFTLRAEASDDDPVYFVAARFEGQIQIGPMLRMPFPESGYVLRVGAPSGPPAPAAGRAAWIVGVLAVLGMAIVFGVRPPSRRRLLLQLARLEEARAAGIDDGARARQRARIRTRLRRAAGP